MPECAVCSAHAPHKCAACKSVSYCSPAHQKEDWKAHKKVCPTLALETREYETSRALELKRLAQEAKDAEELLLRIATCLAQNGYHTEVGTMVQLNKAFWSDEQIWDAFKDVPGTHGRTRLMYASSFDLLKRLRWLLARGAKVNTAGGVNTAGCTTGRHTSSSPSRENFTALMLACFRGHLDIVRELCARDADVNAIEYSSGSTTLMLACSSGNLEIVRELCNRGANMNACLSRPDGAPNSINSLACACLVGHLEIFRELYTRGANVTPSALANACSFGHLEVASFLCDRGASMILGDCPFGLTPLMSASGQGHLDIVRVLCSWGVDLNASRTDTGGTALFAASKHGHLDIVRELCDRGADVNANMATDGFTPLIIATCCGHLEIVRELCDSDADVNASTTNGMTALMWASRAGPLEVVRYLCGRGANVNAAETDDSYTALMWASMANRPRVARLLLARGARKAAISINGDTAYSLARDLPSGPSKKALCALLEP